MDSCSYGIKGSWAYFQRSIASKVLAELIYRICELYIDDLLIHDLRDDNVAAKAKLGLTQVEYVGHLISAYFGTERRLVRNSASSSIYNSQMQ